MSALHPTNGTSVLAATPTNEGIFDTMIGELNYLAQALRENAAPAPQAPAMGGVQPADKPENNPSFAPTPAPGRTFH